MSAVSYLGLLTLAVPETILAVTVLVLLRRTSWRCGGGIALPAAHRRDDFLRWCAARWRGCWCCRSPRWVREHVGGGPLSQFIKVAVLGLAAFTILISVDTDFTPHVGEYFALILLAAVGMMFLVSSTDLLMILSRSSSRAFALHPDSL